MSDTLYPIRLHSITWEATDVRSFAFASVNGDALAPFEPGSHVKLQLPNGMLRAYSLSNQSENGLYRITVARDGGSSSALFELQPGAILDMSAPKKSFGFVANAELSVFLAGGIGITPFMPMMAHLNERGRAWRLHYGVRARDRAPLLREVYALAAVGLGEIAFSVDNEPDSAPIDVAKIVGALGADHHVYCCGPPGMLDAFTQACRDHATPAAQIHCEYFGSKVKAASGDALALLSHRALADNLSHMAWVCAQA